MKNLKKYEVYLLVPFVLLIVLYAVFLFISLEFNIFKWDSIDRLLFLIFEIVGSFFIGAWINGDL